MSRSLIKAEIIWDLSELRALHGEWNILLGMGQSEPSTSLEWTDALIETHLSEADIVFGVVLREAGRVVAIVPAMIRREKLIGPLRVATLSFLSELYNTHSDILRASDSPEIVAALFKSLVSLPRRWDIFRVGRLLESSPVTSAMVQVVVESNLAHRVRREQPSFHLVLGRSFEQFLASRSSKFRNYLKRKSRQLDELGQVEILCAGRDLDLEDAYRDLLTIDEHSWKHLHGTAISANPGQRTFYRSLCDGALRRNRLHLLILYLSGRPIAYNLGLKLQDRYYYLKTSYDEEFRRHSPATVLRARLIETLISEGVGSLDFPAEPYQWEEQWTDQLRWHSSILLYNRTWQALLYRVLITARDAFRPGRGDNDVKYVDPRKLRAR